MGSTASEVPVSGDQEVMVPLYNLCICIKLTVRIRFVIPQVRTYFDTISPNSPIAFRAITEIIIIAIPLGKLCDCFAGLLRSVSFSKRLKSSNLWLLLLYTGQDWARDGMFIRSKVFELHWTLLQVVVGWAIDEYTSIDLNQVIGCFYLEYNFRSFQKTFWWNEGIVEPKNENPCISRCSVHKWSEICLHELS